MVLITTLQDAYFVPSFTTGMTLCKFRSFESRKVCTNIFSSVRAKLRDADPEYDFASSYFLRCLYEGESGDVRRPEIGFLKGPLLLRVSSL